MKQEKKPTQDNLVHSTFSKKREKKLGKRVFKLLKRHFSKRHKMSKVFNKDTVKLSYSCCRNISSKIYSNNRRILTHHLLIMVAVVDIDPTAHLIISV